MAIRYAKIDEVPVFVVAFIGVGEGVFDVVGPASDIHRVVMMNGVSIVVGNLRRQLRHVGGGIGVKPGVSDLCNNHMPGNVPGIEALDEAYEAKTEREFHNRLIGTFGSFIYCSLNGLVFAFFSAFAR